LAFTGWWYSTRHGDCVADYIMIHIKPIFFLPSTIGVNILENDFDLEQKPKY